MSEANDQSAVLSTQRILSAKAQDVFAAFAQPDLLAQWWGPHGFRNTFQQFEFTPGGRWVYVMHGPNGADHPNESIFQKIEPDRAIVLQHLSPPQFTLSITLTPHGDQTHLTWDQEFETAELAAKMRSLCEPANEQNLDRLATILATAKS